MTISSYHIQNIIRAYGQRLGRRSSRLKVGAESRRPTPDMVTISEEGKKRQIAENLANELVARLGDGREQALDPSLVERLSSELGGRLEVASKEKDESGFRFKVLDPDKGEIIKEFSAQNIDELLRNLTSRA